MGSSLDVLYSTENHDEPLHSLHDLDEKKIKQNHETQYVPRWTPETILRYFLFRLDHFAIFGILSYHCIKWTKDILGIFKKTDMRLVGALDTLKLQSCSDEDFLKAIEYLSKISQKPDMRELFYDYDGVRVLVDLLTSIDNHYVILPLLELLEALMKAGNPEIRREFARHGGIQALVPYIRAVTEKEPEISLLKEKALSILLLSVHIDRDAVLYEGHIPRGSEGIHQFVKLNELCMEIFTSVLGDRQISKEEALTVLCLLADAAYHSSSFAFKLSRMKISRREYFFDFIADLFLANPPKTNYGAFLNVEHEEVRDIVLDILGSISRVDLKVHLKFYLENVDAVIAVFSPKQENEGPILEIIVNLLRVVFDSHELGEERANDLLRTLMKRTLEKQLKQLLTAVDSSKRTLRQNATDIISLILNSDYVSSERKKKFFNDYFEEVKETVEKKQMMKQQKAQMQQMRYMEMMQMLYKMKEGGMSDRQLEHAASVMMAQNGIEGDVSDLMSGALGSGLAGDDAGHGDDVDAVSASIDPGDDDDDDMNE